VSNYSKNWSFFDQKSTKSMIFGPFSPKTGLKIDFFQGITTQKLR